MMKKTKNMFLLTICAVLLGGAITNVSAQSSNRRDTERLINYYEWLFETEFTDDQRSRYNEIKEEDYRLDYANEKNGINNLMTTFAKTKSKSENEQSGIRATMLSSFIKRLEEASNDKEAAFLLSVYADAQAKAVRETEASGGDIGALVGKWVWAHTGANSISNGGIFLGSNGSRFTYDFAPNGDVQFTGMMNIMQGGCNQQIFRSIRGKASVSGVDLTISWQPEKYTRDFSCDAANNYTKTMPARIERRKISFKMDLGQEQMCFVGAECFNSIK